jgi:hypothetical protein
MNLLKHKSFLNYEPKQQFLQHSSLKLNTGILVLVNYHAGQYGDLPPENFTTSWMNLRGLAVCRV